MSKYKFKGSPYSDMVSEYAAVRPSDVEGLNNLSVIYYYEWLIKKLFGVYEITGIPDGWDTDYLYCRIFLDGRCCITDTALGVLPLRTGVSGLNVFDHPTTCVIANPVLGNLERTIDVDCALVKLQYNYNGVWSILNRYATLLSMCDSATAVNLLNSKVAHVFAAENKAEAEAYKKMYDQVSEGKPAVFLSTKLAAKLGDNLLFNRVKESFIADTVENVKQQIINDYLSDIGINNANTEKRERLVQNEVASNKDEVAAGAEHWLTNIREGFDKANELFGLNLRIRRREWTRDELSESTGLSADNAG